MKKGSNWRLAASAAAVCLALAGCTQTASLQSSGTLGGAKKGAATTTSVFPDIPIPTGAEMNVDKTLVVGTENWFGQLALNAPQGPFAMFDFFRNRLPQYGWREITSVRAPVSVLTYDRDNRILQMQIKGTTLRGSEITITVSPRGNNSGTTTPRGTSRSGVGSGGSVMPAPVTRVN